LNDVKLGSWKAGKLVGLKVCVRRQRVNRTEEALSKFIVAMQCMCYYLYKINRSNKDASKSLKFGIKKTE
jgi:hypothetical protein